jgi:hypothetical protein
LPDAVAFAVHYNTDGEVVMRVLRPCIAVFATLGIFACAELRWEKAGADAETVAYDLGACRTQARSMVARSAPIAPPVSLGPATSRVQIDPKTGVVREAPVGPTIAATGPQQGSPSLAIEEQEAADRCMRAKGYHLVPAQK